MVDDEHWIEDVALSLQSLVEDLREPRTAVSETTWSPAVQREIEEFRTLVSRGLVPLRA